MRAFRSGTIGVVGAGTIGASIIEALVETGFNDIIASRRSPERAQELTRYGISGTTDNSEVFLAADTIILAVKPQQLDVVLEEARPYAANKLWISVAAGKTVRYLVEGLASDRVVRSMPSAAYRVGEGFTPYVVAAGCLASDERLVQHIFGLRGDVISVKEEVMNALTVGPCEIGLHAKALHEVITGLDERGLSKDISMRMLKRSLRGLAVLIEQGMDLETIYSSVASKGGATEAAYNHGLAHGFYTTKRQMVHTIIDRCEELAR